MNNSSLLVQESAFTVKETPIESLYEDPIIRILGIVFHGIILVIGSLLWFGIIHFERFGGDPQKRSISNYIVSYIASSVLTLKVLIIECIIIVRFVRGCLHFIMGEILMISRYFNVQFIAIMCMINMLYKCFQLYFPNYSLRLNDDFWSIILLITSMALSMIVIATGCIFGFHYNASFQILTCALMDVHDRKM